MGRYNTSGVNVPHFMFVSGNWERKRPVWVMLMVNSLTESDIRGRGVPVLDLFLAQEAEKMTKTTGAVEQVTEQCTPLNGLNFSQVRPFRMLCEVDCFKYLGPQVAADGGWDWDVVHRMNGESVGELKSVLINRGLGIKDKKCLYEGVIVQTALYGARHGV